MDPLFVHHLRRLLLLYGHGVQLQDLPGAWEREFSVPLDWRLHGFASLSQLLANAPSACVQHHGSQVTAVATAQTVVELTEFIVRQVREHVLGTMSLRRLPSRKHDITHSRFTVVNARDLSSLILLRTQHKLMCNSRVESAGWGLGLRQT